MAIYQKGDTWFIDYYFEGKRVRERAGSNKTAAKQALAKRQSEILEGKFFPKQNGATVLFKDFAELYWKLHGQYRRSHSYKSMLKALVAEFGDVELDRLTVPGILDYRNRVKERASCVQANRHMALLRSMLNKAQQWGKVTGGNPAAKIKLDRENNHRLRFLTEEEINKLLSVCCPRIYPVIACAILTGMRRGEILNLQWEHVDLEHRNIYVLQTKSGVPREIPIARKLDLALRELGPKAAGSVFGVPDIYLTRYFTKALKNAGIANFHFHDLRHTFASHYIMRTADLPSLQRLLGHASPMMTQRYAHLAANHLRSGIDLLDSGMDTFWTPSKPSDIPAFASHRQISYSVPTELLTHGAVAQRLERSFHKR